MSKSTRPFWFKLFLGIIRVYSWVIKAPKIPQLFTYLTRISIYNSYSYFIPHTLSKSKVFALLNTLFKQHKLITNKVINAVFFCLQYLNMLTPISLNQNHIGQLVIQKYSFQKYPHILYKGESVNNI